LLVTDELMLRWPSVLQIGRVDCKLKVVEYLVPPVSCSGLMEI